jgi:hypothetical protein
MKGLPWIFINSIECANIHGKERNITQGDQDMGKDSQAIQIEKKQRLKQC